MLRNVPMKLNLFFNQSFQRQIANRFFSSQGVQDIAGFKSLASSETLRDFTYPQGIQGAIESDDAFYQTWLLNCKMYGYENCEEKLQEMITQNKELFTLTYGAFVAQLLNDYENVDEVNKQLDKMSEIILIVTCRNPNIGRCVDFRETADVITKQGFKTYLGIVPTISNWSTGGDEFSLLLDGNPLTEFVELPEQSSKLNYNQMICGAIRGALEMVQLEVECRFVQDQLKGDNITELRIKFIKLLEDALPVGED
ncbi:unnamed protein product [Didymodactylos carnosus]|uniref:Trafficking protein particle complex subunit n=2 Tax=Bdelloidea TaxID=44578 RepID=A0A814HIR4_9BILA|nr:unnamed protein product [Didymodactylos carnosus]CAF1159177.1 unnamed protein product [Didymodactylos carnosus]CAF3782062.1 unnamed protein product [Didymodactylos carnosus]CAF3970775.1 unnamed protein product [Didymodactylos carnosus]